MSNALAYKLGAGLAIGTVLMLAWVSMAVGVLLVEGDRVDIIYVAVVAIGVFGALVAGFRARGTAIAMFLTAFAQASVILFALAAGIHRSPVSSMAEVVGVNGMFAAMFAGSGVLFWIASMRQTSRVARQG